MVGHPHRGVGDTAGEDGGEHRGDDGREAEEGLRGVHGGCSFESLRYGNDALAPVVATPGSG
jgi:hypothetical protein